MPQPKIHACAAARQAAYRRDRLRYEKGSILLTSNLAPAAWAVVFGDGLIASAALARLTHHGRLTCIEGESYRQRRRRSEGSTAVPADGCGSPLGEGEASRDASGGKR
jgi:hypothetical protein